MKPIDDDSMKRLRRVIDTPDMEGTRYRPVRRIGEGGMGTVYLADDTGLHRMVAIKVLSLSIEDAQMAERLLAEAQVVARLEHPGIVPIHDAGRLPDGRVYYAMKYIQGATLAQFVSTGPPLSEKLRVYLRVCEAVAFAHSRGVIHRDLKPANIMVGGFGEVLVMDWGVARQTAQSDAAARDTEVQGYLVGTPAYMAPEQGGSGPGRVDARSDVYSLGAVLYFLLAGDDPEARGGDDESPRRRNRSVSRRLGAICRKAMSRDRECRYGSVDDLAADIRRWLDREPVTAYRENIFERSGRWISRNQLIVVIVAVYVIVRILIYIFYPR